MSRRSPLHSACLRARPWLMGLALFGLTATPMRAQTPNTAEPEVRGTWMTTTANDAIANPTNTAESMRRLREIGLNTVYVECWKNGYTEFPSEAMDERVGVSMKINDAPAELQRDLLDETLNAAHREGLIYIAWFEYGFMAAFKDTHNSLRKQHPEWMTTTADGSLVSDQNPFVWMNPLRPESRQLILDIVTEAIEKYDLDGVQLDDRIAWPTSMGYDPYTVAVYKAEHEGQAPPRDDKDPAWVRWRADKVSEFAKEFYDACKAVNPDILVSISPAVYDWSLTYYACDWPRWGEAGWMEEYVPQVYRFDYPAFERTWLEQVRYIGDRRRDLIAGIRVVGDGPDTTWPDMVKKLDLTRKTKTGGHVHWFSRGVLEVYPEELEAYYDVAKNGPAAHPKFGSEHRPAPIQLRKVFEGDPQADDPSQRNAAWHYHGRPDLGVPPEPLTGRYRVIGRVGDAWHTIRTVDFTDIKHNVIRDIDPRFDAVELLVDRRPQQP
ncbi:MAG: family 10 glycosylhydrolase [Planctomycetota bacterium]